MRSGRETVVDSHNREVLMNTLEGQAQRAAEDRLEACNDMLWAEEDGEPDWRDHPEWDAISAPYCGCDTCVVREVIDAAWPYLKQLAVVAEQADAPDSNSGPAMGAGSSPAGGTHSDYEEVQRLRRAIMQHRFDYIRDMQKSEGDWQYSNIQDINRKLWNTL